MTAEQLKASLLQMAIQGKLVPQLDDEPAVDIDAKEPEEVPFAIPEKWKWVRLDTVISFINGDRGVNYPAKSTLTKKNTGNPFVSAINLQDNKISYDDNLLFLSDEQFNRLGNGKINCNDILLCIRGSLGKWGMSFCNGGAIASSLVILRLRSKKYIHLNFFTAYLNSYLFVDFIKSYKNGAVQPNLSAKSVGGFLFPLPSFAEQRRIVARLNELLPIVDEYGKSQKALHVLETELPGKLRASLLQQAIMGKLVPQLDDEPAVDIDSEELEEVPFAIPEKWKWVRLLDVGTFISGWTPKPYELVSNGEIPYFKVVDMNTEGNEIYMQFTKHYLNKRVAKVFHAGTIVYPKNGGAVFTNKRRILYMDSVVDLNIGGFLHGNFLELQYIFLFLQSLDFRKISKGTALPTIDQVKLKNYPIPIPPLAEQRRIVARLNELFPYVNSMAH